MKANLFNSIIDVLAQRGVLLLSEAAGFYYLLIAVHEERFSLEKALIGFALVLTGAIFEYLVTLAKVNYLKGINEQRIESITREKEQIERDKTKILEELNSFKAGTGSAKIQR